MNQPSELLKYYSRLILNQTITFKCIAYGNMEHYEWFLVYITWLGSVFRKQPYCCFNVILVSLLKSEASLIEKPPC